MLMKYFDVAVGSELEGGERRHKNQVINEVFVRLSEAGLNRRLMILLMELKSTGYNDRRQKG